MDELFSPGVNSGPEIMENMESLMNSMFALGNGEPDPFFLPGVLFGSLSSMNAEWEPPQLITGNSGYGDDDDDPMKIRRMIKTKMQENAAKRTYEEFEEKLEHGILDAPKLNLCKVPPSVFDNSVPITEVHLQDNNIRDLPACLFEELPNIIWLDLRNNKLTSLPDFNSEHEYLRTLLLQQNHIKALPFSLALAINLKTIRLTGNPMVSPPEDIVKQGCRKIIQFLKARSSTNNEHFDGREDEDDEKLYHDLKNTSVKRAGNKTPSSTSVNLQKAAAHSNSDDEKRRAERLIYTWDLWKRIPYDGVSRSDLLQKSLHEARKETEMKINIQKEALLQKCKSKEALQQFRDETRQMQITRKPDTKINPTASAPFGNDVNKIRTVRPFAYMDSTEYKKEFHKCLDTLNEFAMNPIPLSNSDLALKRLKEVQEIHRKLSDMKLSVNHDA